MRKALLLTLIMVLSLAGLPNVFAQDDATIADTLGSDEQFSILLSALEQAELLESLEGEGPFTLFAPTDAAFDSLPAGMLEGVLSSPPSLAAILNYHIVEGEILPEALTDGAQLVTLLGAPLAVTVGDEGPLLNETVLVSEEAIETANGLIYAIDSVIIPERPGSSSAGEEEAEEDNSLAGLIATNSDLSFLATALQLAPEVTALLSAEADEEGLRMLLAPNNEAFLTLDAELREAAIADPALLGSILLYHIIPSGMPLSDEEVAAMSQIGRPIELETLLPETTVSLSFDEDGNPLINDVPVVERGLFADNGVMQVLSGLLTPPDEALLSADDLAALLAELVPAEEDADADESSFEEGPALDPTWAAVADGFGMAELDTADDFFVTVVDPFTQDELYGVQIINWVAEYQYTGFIVEEFLTAEVLNWLGEQDPTTWENISVTTLTKIAAEELALLPEDVQALAE